MTSCGGIDPRWLTCDGARAKSKMIKFQDLDTFTELDVEEALRRNADGELPLVSITIALAAADPAYAQQVCLRLAADPRANVRGNALVSLGHIARRFRCLDELPVKTAVEAGLAEHDEYVRHSAQSAVDEIHQFLGWNFQNHVYGVYRI
jgi:hypothetical protein